MKTFKIIIERSSYTSITSIGDMYFYYVKNYVDLTPTPVKERFSYTLEDTVRPGNIKVSKYTALPCGIVCNVSLFDSPKFGKTIIFHTEDDGITIKHGNLRWTHVLAHGGNDSNDTDACVLVAKNKIDNDHIQGSMMKELRKIVEEKINRGYKIIAEFVNIDQLM